MIIVTGSRGYIGRETVRELVRQGIPYIGLDISPSPNDEAREISLDVTNGPKFKKFLKKTQENGSAIQAIIHLAAKVQVAEAEDQPGPYYVANVHGLATVAEISAYCGVKRFVFASSAACNGNGLATKYLPTAVYGWTKLAGEQVLAAINERYGMDCFALRYFNVAGGAHDSETHILPNLVRAHRKHKKFTLYGDPEKIIRDYIHVRDVASANVHFAHKPKATALPSSGLPTIDIGAGVGTSTHVLLRKFRSEVGNVHIQRLPTRSGDVSLLTANPTQARLRGWQAKLTLSSIIESANEETPLDEEERRKL